MLLFIVSISSSGFSQDKNVAQQTQTWSQYTFMGRISQKWSLYFDFVDRFNKIVKSENTIFYRPAIVYDLAENVSVYLGYCYASYYKSPTVPLILREQRPWQQLLINNKVGRISLQHRYRLEERFNQEYRDGHKESAYTFTWRFRYKLNVQYPVWRKSERDQAIGILLSDELITSFGKNVVVSYFNQNRLFLGVYFQLNKNFSASFGYTNIFRSTDIVGNYININAPTLNINQKMNFRKSKK